ncbi:peptidoglycan DD-metalloendopeptidase family protein [uncultured Subdoligranulum sp.]|uniref:murein hydrolase activator EnvC family protein n=1 Tax=uncultured Subdoligranulum sp. TaxID=512298 RepID=UPI0025CC5D22|nr:peptidoglycan DD-metalloendopeptidase family protein [uncultured Subdoligranulum sp.]
MTEEKERTTTPQVHGGKHRRRRKKNNHTPQQAAVQKTPEPDKPEVPAALGATAQEKQSKPFGEQPEPKEATVPENQPPQAVEAEPAEPAQQPETAESAQPAGEPEKTPAAPATGGPEPAREETPNVEEATMAESAVETMPAAQTEETPAAETAVAITPSEEETAAAEPEAAQERTEEKEAEETVSPTQSPEKTAENKPETSEQTSDEAAAQEITDRPEEPEDPEEEKRLSDMTRTVQLSVEQIMACVSDEETPAPNGEDAEATGEESTEEDGPATLTDQVRNGLSGMAKWMLLVLFFVLVIAGFGVAWLYRSATPDMLPQITVTFAGQTVEPTAYKWKVPVVGNLFKRTYADTLSSTPVTLAEAVEQVSPDVTVSPSGYRTELTVTDSNEETIFEGDVDAFSAFQFTANGTYNAQLVVHSDVSSVPGDTSVTGSETWKFTFTVGVRSSVRLSGTTVNQGSAVAVRVGETLDGQPPQIKTELQNTGFFAASSGWVCYLPIPWNQSAGTQTIEVTAGGYTETLELKIRATEWEYKDYYSNSQRVSPYIGENDIPAELQKLLQTSETTIGWSDGSFVQPFLNTLDVKLAFGTTEYVGRSYSERQSNNGAGGRTVTNLVLNTKAGELLIAPASGKVLLAKDLGGDFGYTLVIDHGAGVKSIFYNLQALNVKAGASVKQGQTLATCNSTTVAEMRIGTVPIDPLQVWRGQCDALKNY